MLIFSGDVGDLPGFGTVMMVASNISLGKEPVMAPLLSKIMTNDLIIFFIAIIC